MKPSAIALILAGAIATAVIGVVGHIANAPGLVARLESGSRAELDSSGSAAIIPRFRTPQGWLTRHPVLSGGDALDDTVRARAAAAVASISGIGGVRWSASARRRTDPAGEPRPSLHCQQDVEAVLQARSIRFAEASAAIDPASEEALDEVAAALKPCLGSIIAITGHTDAAGPENANVALSFARADAVRKALTGRGIPAGGLRARGYGSAKPLPGLTPADSANRRIEFLVLSTVPLAPTPVDTPGAG